MLQGLYYFRFRDLNDALHNVEIWKDTPTTLGAAEEIIGDANPFTVSMPKLSSKFQPVRGTGCQMVLNATTDRKFLSLYTANMQEYQIRHYIDSVLNWTGWLDSELYSEPFSDLDNYPVAFSGTDGLALLNRMYYLDDSGEKFTGISTQFEVLQFILQKLNLPLLNVNIYLSTTLPGITVLSDETILHHSYVINSNFYNEDGDPETLRTVLESILQPYGAFICQMAGSLFITDVHALAGASLWAMQKYKYADFTYVDEYGIDANLGDLSTIGFASDSQTFNVVPGINKQIVKFSPYNQVDIIDYSAEEDFTTAGAVTNYGTSPYRWKETAYDTSVEWSKAGDGKFIKLEGVDDTTSVDYYLKTARSFILSNVITKQFEYRAELPTVVPASGYKLRLKMDGFFRRSADLENPTFVPSVVKSAALFMDLVIGSKKYGNYSSTGAWIDSSSTADYFVLNFQNAPQYNSATGATVYIPIEDQWTPSGEYKRRDQQFSLVHMLIPIDSGFIASTVSLKIYGYLCENLLGAATTVEDARFKNIKLTVVDADGNDVQDVDFEYIGYMNPAYKETGSDIKTILGTNHNNFPTCRGGILKNVSGEYSYMQEWTRAGITDLLENLLLRSYVGNYEGKTRELVCTLNRIPSTLGYLTYAAYLTGKYMPVAFTHDYWNAATALTLQEIFTDALTISKSF